MAAKKKEGKSSSKKQTAKKVKLTFAPIMGAGVEYTALLREKAIKNVYGREQTFYSPAIEGLPMEFTVRKGQIVEVTEEQLKELQARGHVETDEEHLQRQNFIHTMSPQHPETLSWDLIVAEGSNFATLLDSQNIVYNDKLLIVD